MQKLRLFGVVGAALWLTATTALAHDEEALRQSPPPAPFAQVSKLVALPDFIPGLGALYVDPATLPAGPFLGYDRDGNIAATIYMTPLEDLQNGTAFDDLRPGLHKVTSVDIYYNSGHPGVDKPHAHVVLFHDVKAKERLTK